ncbi:IPT/TIG domain-containing protein [Variovorax sp. PCZ-1]|uniref:beta strand repeat-containing protein n=1 Tax=Variovorax sp. PCZ-1 TaxID=2835533 RepID=UPI001BCCC5A8|nr:IPT/TIG domain-containing protein [Variovorax sp. PCZ-1]MBS7807944.1 IPT/TIG domain-containing protein [Variovorax sp. PCZ-1]
MLFQFTNTRRLILRRGCAVAASALLAIGLVACGGGGGGSNPPNTQINATGLSVTPSLGLVRNADTSATCLANSAVLGTGTTGTSGRVSLSLNAGCSGPVMVSVVANAGTTYFDEGVNAFVAMAPVGTSMRALLPSLAGASTLSLGVTPLTEIATRQAIANAGGNAANVGVNQVLAANTNVVTQVLGSTVTLDILAEPTLISSQPTSGNLGTGMADRYAFYLAALARAAGHTGTTPALDAMNALAADLADGTLNGGSSGGFTYTQSGLSNQINGGIASAANVYASAALQTNLGLGGGSGTPTVAALSISSFTPGSGSVGANVTVTGTGFDSNISHFQVKFNGVNATISNATSTTLRVQVPNGATTGLITVVRVVPDNASITSATNFTVTGGGGNSSTWTQNASPSGFGLGALAANGSSTFVALGGGLPSNGGCSAYYSTNGGVNWTQIFITPTRPSPCLSLSSIAWTGSQFVAVGSSGSNTATYSLITTSPDGITWTERNYPSSEVAGFGTNILRAVAASGSKIIAADFDLVLTSTDNGATWTRESGSIGFLTVNTNRIAGMATDGITTVVAGCCRQNQVGNLIVTEAGFATRTGNGAWQTVTTSGFYPYAVTYNGSHFVAVGNAGPSITDIAKAAYSTDGINWTVVNMGTNPAALYVYTVASAGSTLYAVANGQTGNFPSFTNYSYIMKSTDNGATWTVDYTGNPPPNTIFTQSAIAATPNRIVSVGSGISYRRNLP